MLLVLLCLSTKITMEHILIYEPLPNKKNRWLFSMKCLSFSRDFMVIQNGLSMILGTFIKNSDFNCSRIMQDQKALLLQRTSVHISGNYFENFEVSLTSSPFCMQVVKNIAMQCWIFFQTFYFSCSCASNFFGKSLMVCFEWKMMVGFFLRKTPLFLSSNLVAASHLSNSLLIGFDLRQVSTWLPVSLLFLISFSSIC